MAENKLNEMIETSLGKIRELAGTETVVGDPIYTPDGTLILPVSKVSMGFASGGLDYGSRKESDNAKAKDRFGGGGGTGVTVTPIAFLIISAAGKIDLIPIAAPQGSDTVDKVASLIERSPEILQRLKDVFVAKKKEKEAVTEAPEGSESTEEA